MGLQDSAAELGGEHVLTRDNITRLILNLVSGGRRQLPNLGAAVLTVMMATFGTAEVYQEAPMLRKLVAAGKLPPVKERLPEEPLVVAPLCEIGKYGGTWRRLAITPQDSLMSHRLGYEPLVRWDRGGTRPTPGVAKAWKIENGGRRYILYLRKGIKWSDGRPFTSEDVLYWFEDVATSKELSGSFIALAPKDTTLRVSAPDPHVLVFEFDKPNGIFLEKLCYLGHFIYAPKHYMRQFHVKYADRAKLDQMVADAGFDHWAQLYLNRTDLSANPERPTISPWKLETGPPAMMYIVERNPFYWKVDTAGNQLPYIDRISFRVVDSKEVLNFIACTSAVDMQARYIDSTKYTLFMSPENRKRGGIVRYRVLADAAAGANVGGKFNLSTQNKRVRPFISDRRFRIALTVSINRQEAVELITGGLGDIMNGVGFPLDRYFVPGMDQQHIQYDPDLANRLLDEVGLKRGPNGMRRYPDGKPFREILYCETAGVAGELHLQELVVAYWREVGLEFVMKPEPSEHCRMRAMNGDFDFMFDGHAGMHWVLQPSAYVPLTDLALYAPQYGRYVQTNGKSGVRPTSEFQRLIDWYYELVHTFGDDEHQLELGRKILWQWSNECYIYGVYRRHDLAILSNRFRNFPDHVLHGWRVQCPGYMQPEQFYLESEQHTIRAEAGPHGNIYPSGGFQVYHGMEQEFTITPNDGYVVEDVQVNGESVGGIRSYRLDRVTAEVSIKAAFRSGGAR